MRLLAYGALSKLRALLDTERLIMPLIPLKIYRWRNHKTEHEKILKRIQRKQVIVLITVVIL